MRGREGQNTPAIKHSISGAAAAVAQFRRGEFRTDVRPNRVQKVIPSLMSRARQGSGVQVGILGYKIEYILGRYRRHTHERIQVVDNFPSTQACSTKVGKVAEFFRAINSAK